MLTILKMIDKIQLNKIFKKCWSLESSSKWEEDSPWKGQCSVTALVVHDHFGGKILKTNIDGQWHFYNKVNDQVFDLTSEQFNKKINYQNIESTVEEALLDTSQKQYKYLKGQFAKHYLEASPKEMVNI